MYINGALMRTACLESTDPDLVLETRTRLHLADHENVNYLLAIKRVIGMTPLPDSAFYRANIRSNSAAERVRQSSMETPRK